MRFWISKNNEVPIRDQLTTQIKLGILSNDLKPKEKLPSTRELARRLKIHSNTVSAAYQELVGSDWLEFRKGSGVYVQTAVEAKSADRNLELDRLISNFIQSANNSGYTLGEIQSRLRKILEVQPPDRFVLIEEDPELRAILADEIRTATGFPVHETDISECSNGTSLTGAVVVAAQHQAAQVKNTLSGTCPLIVLNTSSLPASLKGEKRLPATALVTVASRWPRFLELCETILVAAGVDRECINLRDVTKSGWQRGLSLSTLVIADSRTASQLPNGLQVRVVQLIADKSIEDLRRSIRN